METGAARLKQLLGAKVVVSLSEVRMFRGQMIGYDKHLNVVLRESEECRLIDGQLRSEPRGLIVIRGINVSTIGADSVPIAQHHTGSLWQTGIGTAEPRS